jgi:FkbM family methyltransferase
MIKRLIRAPFRLIGYDIVRCCKPDYVWLQELGIRTLIDIGANVGQYATYAREIFPEAQIYSFEPLKDCFEQLKKKMNGDFKFQAFNFALGDEHGEAQINHNEHSAASSLLKMVDLHHKHYIYAINTKSETIRIERLDDVTRSMKIKTPLMIKIDVQGFEDKVISGGVETIRKAKILIVETSFEVLYEGQSLFGDIYEKLKKLGFIYYSNDHQVRSDKDRRVLQENSVFIKLKNTHE